MTTSKDVFGGEWKECPDCGEVLRYSLDKDDFEHVKTNNVQCVNRKAPMVCSKCKDTGIVASDLEPHDGRDVTNYCCDCASGKKEELRMEELFKEADQHPTPWIVKKQETKKSKYINFIIKDNLGNKVLDTNFSNPNNPNIKILEKSMNRIVAAVNACGKEDINDLADNWVPTAKAWFSAMFNGCDLDNRGKAMLREFLGWHRVGSPIYKLNQIIAGKADGHDLEEIIQELYNPEYPNTFHPIIQQAKDALNHNSEASDEQKN